MGNGIFFFLLIYFIIENIFRKIKVKVIWFVYVFFLIVVYILKNDKILFKVYYSFIYNFIIFIILIFKLIVIGYYDSFNYYDGCLECVCVYYCS